MAYNPAILMGPDNQTVDLFHAYRDAQCEFDQALIDTFGRNWRQFRDDTGSDVINALRADAETKLAAYKAARGIA